MRLLTLKSVMVATDFDEGSGAALRTAARLAPLAEAELHVLHVAHAPLPDGDRRVRDALVEAVGDAVEPASAKAAVGTPAAAMVEHALRVRADAIVLGRHRGESETGRDMGSTAAEVVARAPCPCLVAATELRLPLGRLLVPIDLSEITAGTLSVALSWATALRAPAGRVRMTVLYVGGSAAGETTARVREEVERAGERAGGATPVEMEDVVAEGTDAAAEILRRSAEGSFDLVVMGVSGAGEAGETAAGGPALGSVSAAVARATNCPLLLVPPRIWREHGRS